jgi:hypothetical protein
MTNKGRTFAQHDEDGLLDKNFEKLVEEMLQVWHVPGVSVAVVDGGNTWFKVHPVYRSPILILTAPLGLWCCLVPFDTRDSLHAFLYWKYDKSIHGSYHGLSCR